MKNTINQQETKEHRMINLQYKEWFLKNWTNKGGLITQSQASKILGKTRTRIRQMINEKKLQSFQYKDETPLVSLAEILEIYDKEENEYWEAHEAMMTPSSEELAIQAAYEQEQEEHEAKLNGLHSKSYTEKELIEIEFYEQEQKEIKERYNRLKEEKEKIEDELESIEKLIP